jgi:hypothetical protein
VNGGGRASIATRPACCSLQSRRPGRPLVHAPAATRWDHERARANRDGPRRSGSLDEPLFRDYTTPSEQRFRVRFGRLAAPWFTYLMLAPTASGLVAGSGRCVLRIVDDGSPRYTVVLEKE